MEKLTPDFDSARRFLETLESDADLFTFQTFDDSERKDQKLVRTLHGTFDELAPQLAQLNERGAGIFVTVNETDGTARKAENIKRVRALFVDLDGAPVEPVRSFAFPPHMLVQTSPDRWHAYWLVTGIGLDEFRSVQVGLIAKFQADPAVKDLPRVMRLPGFYHRKGQPYLVRLSSVQALAPYAGGEFRPAQQNEPLPPPASEATGPSDETAHIIDEQLRKLAETNPRGHTRNNVLNKTAYTLGGLVGAGLADEDDIRNRLLAVADELGLARREATATINSGLSSGIKAPWTPGTVLDPSDPMRSARKLVDDRFRDKTGFPLLIRHRDTFWQWTGSHYKILEKEPVEAIVWKYTERAKALGKQGPALFKPTPDKVNAIVSALRAATQFGRDIDLPAWIVGGEDSPPPTEFMAVKNGLLHLPKGEPWNPTPHFFNTSASAVSFDPDAPPPRRWLRFLDETFGDDMEARQAMQEFIGYILTPDTSQQKILLVVGPPRSGKGTMGRVIRELVGHDSIAAPTMHSLSGEFGLEPLIPRPVAIISDARIGARTDKAAVTERLLSISGEDPLSINRKNSSFWHGRLQTRFAILTNELPALSDSSGALANRFIIVHLSNSFLGNEDPMLFETLKGEMPGILNWAIEGYERLRQRGRFIQPTSGQQALDEILMLASPEKAFVKEMCIVRAGRSMSKDALWEEWRRWCERNQVRVGSRDWFFRNLRTAVPGLKDAEPTVDGMRTPTLLGIALSEDALLRDEALAEKKRQSDDVPF
jgi:putative DNA primase/helicase